MQPFHMSAKCAQWVVKDRPQRVGKLTFAICTYALQCGSMKGELFLWIAVGCVTSLALDWAIYERVGASLEAFWPRLSGQFTFRRSTLLRKLAIVAAGALVAFGALNGNGALIVAACVVWVVLHSTIYLEWIAASRSQPVEDADPYGGRRVLR